ncbi:MAG: class I SAM-dependent methyltransferase, partial [Chloroflexi bacterium]|nr:class I SAM-dependent methyltransferase [Chloroflexota bacterium]
MADAPMGDRYSQTYHSHERARHWEQRADLVMPRRQEVFEVILAALGLPDEAAPRLIDLGAGTGSLAERALARWPGARVVCVDSSAEMIERGQ